MKRLRFHTIQVIYKHNVGIVELGVNEIITVRAFTKTKFKRALRQAYAQFYPHPATPGA